MKKLFYIVLCFLFLSAGGCIPRGRVSYIEQFVIDYNLTEHKDITPLNASVKIERFSIIEIYNSIRMHYKTSPFKLNTYTHSRWRVNPADLLSDYFIRDISNANIFTKVFIYKDPDNATFTVEGRIEEFLEVIEDGRSYSLLTLDITLIDNRETSITKKIIFQKKYREKEPFSEHNPDLFAKAMSNAFKKISDKVIYDIYNTLKQKEKIILN